MKQILKLAVLLLSACAASSAGAAPVLGDGSIFVDPDIVTAASPTSFAGLSYAGIGQRSMFDRRANSFVLNSAYLFNASFSDGRTVEIQVNSEFASAASALKQASYYGRAIGQLPIALRTSLDTVWIHQGVQGFGGGNNNLLIHIGQADLYVASGILEEALIHEAVHTSIDAAHAASAGWLAAQQADRRHISRYAADNALREDFAETFLMWLGVRHFSDRMAPETVAQIEAGIPNRLAFLDRQNFDLFPLVSRAGHSVAADDPRR